MGLLDSGKNIDRPSRCLVLRILAYRASQSDVHLSAMAYRPQPMVAISLSSWRDRCPGFSMGLSEPIGKGPSGRLPLLCRHADAGIGICECLSHAVLVRRGYFPIPAQH